MNILKKIDTINETNIVFCVMAIWNFVMIVYLTLVISLTQLRAMESQKAGEIIGSLKALPILPEIRILLAIGCYILVCLCIYTKKVNPDRNGDQIIYLNIYEMCLGIIVMISLDMCYNGILFLIVAELLDYIEKRWSRYGFILLAFLCYIVCNYNLISIVFPLNSFDIWANWYGGTMGEYILGIKTIGEVITIMLFLIYIVFLLQMDRKENVRIRMLNEQLSEVNEQLQMANEQLHVFAKEKEQMGETKERNRLAREIHDTLGHILTGISVGSEAAKVLLEVSPEEAGKQIDLIGNMARNGLNDVRRSVRKLKPDALEKKSLYHAIQQMVEEMSEGTSVKIYFISYSTELNFEADEEEAIYRIVQEGTTNAIRHGKATEIWIRLEATEDQMLLLSVMDNGKGCADIEEGFGLTHIRNRIEMIGGQVEFRGNKGFMIKAKIPIRLS